MPSIADHHARLDAVRHEPPALKSTLIGYAVGIGVFAGAFAFGIDGLVIAFLAAAGLSIWGIARLLLVLRHRIRAGVFPRGFVWTVVLLALPAGMLVFLYSLLNALARIPIC